MSDLPQHVEHGVHDRIDHRAAAEAELAAAWDTDSIRPLLRAIAHALLAHLDQETT